MKHSPIFSDEAVSGRRRYAGTFVAVMLVSLALAACADLKGTPPSADDKPFWQREEQRDD
jgi:hypothetical protein